MRLFELEANGNFMPVCPINKCPWSKWIAPSPVRNPCIHEISRTPCMICPPNPAVFCGLRVHRVCPCSPHPVRGKDLQAAGHQQQVLL
jgi:hypothetical protein